MTASEAARHDLYNGLTQLLGPQRAETLMAALPAYDTSELVTKGDLELLSVEFRTEMAGIGARLVSLEASVVALHLRFDRLFLTLVGGLIVIVGAMAGVVFMP